MCLCLSARDISQSNSCVRFGFFAHDCSRCTRSLLTLFMAYGNTTLDAKHERETEAKRGPSSSGALFTRKAVDRLPSLFGTIWPLPKGPHFTRRLGLSAETTLCEQEAGHRSILPPIGTKRGREAGASALGSNSTGWSGHRPRPEQVPSGSQAQAHDFIEGFT